MFSISVDWENYMEKGWENRGRSLIADACNHKDKSGGEDNNIQYGGYCDKCGISEDSCEPMMNYAYPLETTPDDDKIIEVCKKTNCTVMYKEDEDAYYLVLCGGGMDLSQDIALAYNILERWIPLELALSTSTQDGLSVGGKEFRRVMRACKESLRKDIGNARSQVKRINETIKESLKKAKA